MIKWSAAAKDDLVSVVKYLQDKHSEAATNIVKTIYHTVSRLEEFPLSGRLREPTGTREVVVNKYPYIISYIIIKSDIIIVRILHSRRLPKI